MPETMMMDRLQLGLYLPTWDDVRDRMKPWVELRTVAQLAEEAGWDTLWVPDHFVPRMPDGTIQRFWECWTTLGALAEATSRIALGPLLTPTAFRHPALLARMAATLDEISGRRLLLGLGAGAEREHGFALLRLPLEQRGSMFAEALQVLVPLLREGHVDFAGRYYTVRDYSLELPRRHRGPPIWIGGKGPRMINLAAQWGDAFNLNRALTAPDDAAEPLAQLNTSCGAVGRDPETISRTGYVAIALSSSGSQTALRGSAEEIASRLHAIHQAGICHLTCFLDTGDPSDPPDSLPLVTPQAIERFAPVVDALRRLER